MLTRAADLALKDVGLLDDVREAPLHGVSHPPMLT